MPTGRSEQRDEDTGAPTTQANSETSWLGSVLSYGASFFARPVASATKEPTFQFEETAFQALKLKYRALRESLKTLDTRYRAEKKKEVKESSTLSWLSHKIKPFVPGADCEGDRYRATAFIMSVAFRMTSPDKFSYNDKDCAELMLRYAILKGLVHLETANIEQAYRVSSADGKSFTSGSKLFQMLSSLLPEDTADEKAYSLLKLRNYLTDKGDSEFTYTREVTKTVTLQRIDDLIAQTSPRLLQPAL